jgi:hypothetical protein
MRYILPGSAFSAWQMWWFAPPETELGNLTAWIPTILFWMLVVVLSRLAIIGVGAKLRRRYIETDELPFPAAEAQAGMIKELTTPGDLPTAKLRYFLVGVIVAIVFSLVVEHSLGFIDFSFLVPQLSGLGFGISLSILLFVIGFLIPADQSSGILIGSVIAFVLIPLAFVGLAGSWVLNTVLSIDSSLVLASLLCATIVGSAVTILRTVLYNTHAARLVILTGTKQIYGLARVKKPKGGRRSPERLAKNFRSPLLLFWGPVISLALIMAAVVGTEPGAPWHLSVIILVFAVVITPLAIALGTWVASRTTRITSVSPLPFLYEGTLFGAEIRTLSPYILGAPTVWQASGMLSQLRVARLTRTESKVVYWADLVGFPILGVLLSFLICFWVFASLGAPSPELSSPGTGSNLLAQWNFSPVWSALYTFVTWLAQGGGAFPYSVDPVIYFVVPFILLAVWTILHGLRRIPVASITGIVIGFAILPYMAITIALGTLAAVITKRLKGVEWFSKYATTLGAGLYAGASVSLFFIVLVVPLIF